MACLRPGFYAAPQHELSQKTRMRAAAPEPLKTFALGGQHGDDQE
jgi:hypothetical protein